MQNEKETRLLLARTMQSNYGQFFEITKTPGQKNESIRKCDMFAGCPLDEQEYKDYCYYLTRSKVPTIVMDDLFEGTKYLLRDGAKVEPNDEIENQIILVDAYYKYINDPSTDKSIKDVIIDKINTKKNKDINANLNNNNIMNSRHKRSQSVPLMSSGAMVMNNMGMNNMGMNNNMMGMNNMGMNNMMEMNNMGMMNNMIGMMNNIMGMMNNMGMNNMMGMNNNMMGMMNNMGMNNMMGMNNNMMGMNNNMMGMNNNMMGMNNNMMGINNAPGNINGLAAVRNQNCLNHR